MRERRLVALVAAVACVAVGCIAAVAVTIEDFDRILGTMPMGDDERAMAALEFGLTSACCGFPANETYHLFEHLAAASGAPVSKETIVLVLTRAIEQGIPAASLVDKASEGLARGVELVDLGQLLELRFQILLESRDLFGSKRIFRAPPGGSVAAGATALPASRFDALLSNFGDALGDYLESGGSPFETQDIYDDVSARLTQLNGTVLNADDVDLLLSRIEPADLTQAVSPALR